MSDLSKLPIMNKIPESQWIYGNQVNDEIVANGMFFEGFIVLRK